MHGDGGDDHGSDIGNDTGNDGDGMGDGMDDALKIDRPLLVGEVPMLFLIPLISTYPRYQVLSGYPILGYLFETNITWLVSSR